MKIQAIDFNDTAILQLVHPVTGEDLYADEDNEIPMTVEIYGTESAMYQQALNESNNAMLARRGGEQTAEQAFSAALELLSKLTVSFNDIDFGDGLLDVKNAKNEYRKTSWFKDQVDKGISRKKLFLKTSSAKPKKS